MPDNISLFTNNGTISFFEGVSYPTLLRPVLRFLFGETCMRTGSKDTLAHSLMQGVTMERQQRETRPWFLCLRPSMFSFDPFTLWVRESLFQQRMAIHSHWDPVD